MSKQNTQSVADSILNLLNVPLPGVEPSAVRSGPQAHGTSQRSGPLARGYEGAAPTSLASTRSEGIAIRQGVDARVGTPTAHDALNFDPNAPVNVSPSTQILKNTDNPLIEIVATMLAQGKTKKEIAKITGKDYSSINRIASQPVTKYRLRELLRTNGADGIKAFLAGEIQASFDTLVEIRDDLEARRTDRLSAANALLDRALGKPTQHIETKKVEDIDAATVEIEEINKRLEENRAKLRERGVTQN